MTKVAVLYGGFSAEREVSLRTGAAVYEALLEANYSAHLIDVDHNVMDNIKKVNPDVAFIALHGKGGEDGAIQGLLETLGIPYTGPGILASAMSMNKIITKQILQNKGIPTAPFATVNVNDDLTARAQQIRREIPGKLVVKAPNQGSTIGIYFVEPEADLVAVMKKAFQYDRTILVEKFIPGTEVTASLLGNEDPQVLPLIEIVSHTGVYDYKAKYTKGLSEHIIPARVSDAAAKKVERYSKETFKALFCQGLARVDFIIDENEEPYLLEVNTMPGMTETSLFPDAARAAGISFPQLVSRIVQLALEKI
ncbi:MAG: D-alanine--D-alanine ligase [Thermoanaerobacteraceae bacterium]|nr:D-alanine--D-alanine ligase [Thermoanaerobacteraceae bacterium]